MVAGKHKLIPSVYAECSILKDGKVLYSGNTFVRVRSGKHETSNAFTHAFDLNDLFTSEYIKRKPILVIETDGAQDEAPIYPKPLSCAVNLFKKLKLDALIHGVNAAGFISFQSS